MSDFVGEGCIYTSTPSSVRATIDLPLHGRDFNSTRFRGAITFCERSVRCPCFYVMILLEGIWSQYWNGVTLVLK